MIADVVAAVNDAVPGLLASRRPSVVAVRTTHPKYLVFDGDAARPVCVVEFGDRMRLSRRHHILEQLHERLPDAVPASVCCKQWSEDIYTHIVAGVAGVPWFRLSDRIRTPADWRALLDCAVAAMHLFHEAIATVPQWRSEVSVACALNGQLRRALTCRTRLPRDVIEQLLAAVDAAPLAPVASVWQHGDFSLNNLLITSHGAAIIDFDEFGRTSVPLHDAFGLALSFPLSQAGRCPIRVVECLSACLERYGDSHAIDEAAVRPLLLHHLLWRINECEPHPTRAALRARLLDVLTSVLTCDDDWAEAVGRALP